MDPELVRRDILLLGAARWTRLLEKCGFTIVDEDRWDSGLGSGETAEFVMPLGS